MAAVVTVVYDPQAREPGIGGDISGILINVAVSGNYPAGGEPIDFIASQIGREVFGMAFAGWGKVPIGGGLLVPVALRTSATVWNMRLHASGANANDVLPEFVAGAYPAEADIRFICWCRPFSDAT